MFALVTSPHVMMNARLYLPRHMHALPLALVYWAIDLLFICMTFNPVRFSLLTLVSACFFCCLFCVIYINELFTVMVFFLFPMSSPACFN